MKKMILAVALLLTGIVSAQADGREKTDYDRQPS